MERKVVQFVQQGGNEMKEELILKKRERKELIDEDILIGSLLEKRGENKTSLKYK